MEVFERIIGRGCTFLRPHKTVMHICEGFNDPQQAAGGGLLRGPIVVAGVHRHRAVGIKDTRIEKLYAACRDCCQDCAFLHPV